MKRLFLFLVFAVFCGGYAMASDFSSRCSSGQTLYYNITSSTSPYTVEVVADYYQTYPTGNLTIPSSVTYIGRTYSVTSIGYGAFYDCSGLTSVTIPNSVTSIGTSAFSGCSGLTSVTIPNSVTSIGGYAFSWTGWYNNQPDGILYLYDWCLGYKGDTPTGTLTIAEGTKGIAGNAFSGCSGLTSINIPNSVTSIGEYAYSGCGLTGELTIPSSVTSIGCSAFGGCSGITTINFNATNCTKMGGVDNYQYLPVFRNCTAITTLNIGETVTNIPDTAFYGCNSLTTVNFNATNCTSFGSLNGISGNTNITTLRIGENVETIPNYAFYGCSGLTGTLTIPNSTTSIGENAFYNCSGLTELYIGESVATIGTSAFYGCTGLAGTLTIPNSTTSIGDRAFYGCSGLSTLTIGEGVTSVGYSAFDHCNGLTSVNYNAINCTFFCGSYGINNTHITILNIGENVETIPSYAFYGCSGLNGSLNIPNSVTNIGEWAFHNCSGLSTINFNATNCTEMGSSNYRVFDGCSSLETLNIGENVTNIPDYAFSNCYNITGTLTIPNSVTNIGERAFDGCEGLTELTIGESVTNIGESAFSGCFGLTELTIGESVVTIGNSAFYGCNLTGTLTIPNSVTSIGSGAFYGCSGLTGELTIPNSVTSIGDWAFAECGGPRGGFVSVTIPNSVTSIGIGAFENCRRLTTVNFNATNCATMGISSSPVFSGTILATLNVGENVIKIPSFAFSGCNSLSGELTIPNSVTSIGDSAFYNCNGLAGLTIGESVVTIGNSAFYGCNGLTGTLAIPNSTTRIGKAAFYNCSGLAGLTIGESVATIGDSAFYGCNGLTGTLVIPNSTTSIGETAFYNCSGLAELTIGESVATISGNAFSGCSDLSTINYNATNCTSFGDDNGISGNANITSLTIGNNVTIIPDGAFSGCSGLTTVNFNATNCASMGSSSYPVFANCYANATINIGSNVTTIPEFAFYGLRGSGTLTIPNSVTSIGSSAFYGCSNLTSVNYTGNLAQWCGITFGDNFSNPLRYAHNLFINDSLVTDLVVPDAVTEIKDFVFQNDTCLTSVTIPSSVTSIGERAFNNCNGLTSVIIGNSVTRIGSYAFENCSELSALNYNAANCTFDSNNGITGNTNITTLTIGENVETIPNGAFSGCSGLTTLNYNAINCANFGNNNGLTGNTNITAINIGENVSSIPAGAFKNCTALAEVNFNALNCSTMGSSSNPVFNGCSSLSTLNIGDGVTNIPANAFSGCNGLSGTLTIPNSTTIIGESSFCNCSGLTSLVTGESLASIGASAFAGCSAIRTMSLGSNVETIGNRAFAGCTGLFMATVKPELPPMAQAETFENVSTTAVIKVPCGSVPYYNAAQYWNVFTNVQGDMVYTLTVGSSNDIMGYATVTQAPTCTNPTGIITATANNRYRFVSWNDGNTANPRTVTLTSDAHYIANFESLYPTVYNSFTAEACGSYTWNEQTYTTSGEYQQTFTAVSSADSIVTLSLTIYPMPQPEITASGVLDGCNPSPITLSAGDYSAYNWSTGATTTTISISEPGYYYVEVTDAHGCTGISEQMNIGLSNALTEAPQISVVGMNDENHNVVAWSALDNENVNTYRIYRENNVANVYEPMATVEASQTTWTDETADPSARAYRYKITAVDECSGESPMSDYHKTMHLTINQGIGNTWNLIWSHYEGFDFGTYRIYRGTMPSNMTMIGEVPSNLNSYTDNTATASTGFYYQVEVVRSSRSRDTEISSRSNIVDNGYLSEYTITVMSANPNRGTVSGGGTYPEGTVVRIEATALEGFVFTSWSDENTENPRYITVTGNATYIASFDPATGIEETSAFEIALFPNPATDILNITSSETISEIEIVNTLGQVVKRIEVNSDNAVCDVEELKTGVYIVRIHGPEVASVICQRKFIKE